MIIYVCFIIFDGIVLSSSQPIKISTKSESPDLDITNTKFSEYYVTTIVSEMKSRKPKKSFTCHHNQVKRSLLERSIETDESKVTETNPESSRFKRYLASNHSLAKRSFYKNISGRSIKVDLGNVTDVDSKSTRSKRSLVPHNGHGRRSLLGRSINVDSGSITDVNSKLTRSNGLVKRSLSGRSIKEKSSNITGVESRSTRYKRSSLSDHDQSIRSFSGRSIRVDSINNAESTRPKRSLFHAHGRRSFSEHSSGRSITKVEQGPSKDDHHNVERRDKNDVNGTPHRRRGKRGSSTPHPYDGNILLTVQLFLLFIPLASTSAVVLGVVAPWTTSSDEESSIWASAAGDYARIKDEDDAGDEFVLNRIKGADPLSKRLKLERVLGHQCSCLYDSPDPSGGSEAAKNPPKSVKRRWYYVGLVTVLSMIAFFVFKIVVIVS